MRIHACSPPKKPPALMSTLALSLEFAVGANCSPSRGFKAGSRLTFTHISSRTSPSRSLTSLWRRPKYPPCEQERACSTVKAWPHTHEAGRRGGVQQYRRWRASLNSLFESENPKSAKGRAVSQVTPFSSAAITARFVLLFLLLLLLLLLLPLLLLPPIFFFVVSFV